MLLRSSFPLRDGAGVSDKVGESLHASVVGAEISLGSGESPGEKH